MASRKGDSPTAARWAKSPLHPPLPAPPSANPRITSTASVRNALLTRRDQDFDRLLLDTRIEMAAPIDGR